MAAVHVNCSHAYLSVPPTGLSERVELFDLSHNPLGVVTDDYLEPHAYLHTLHMSYCSIRAISKGAFNNLNKLRVLDLRGNVLSDLDPVVLSHLSSLVDLDLSHNQLSDVSGLLLHKPKLKKLRLQHNQLTSLPKLSSTNSHQLQNLESLNLNTNPLGELQPVSFFAAVPSLTSLHLANTQLRSLPGDVFVNLHHLKVLNLADNSLAEIPAASLKPLQRSVVTLDLSGNPINCSGCVALGLRRLLDELPLVTWSRATAATCRHPPELSDRALHKLRLTDFTCDLADAPETENATMVSTSRTRGKKRKKDEDSPYKSKLGPMEYNPMMGWYTAITLSAMLGIFLVCLALDKLKRQLCKWYRRRRLRRNKGSYRSGSLRHSGKSSHNSIDVMDSISMVAMTMNTPFQRASFNTSFNSSFDTDKDCFIQAKSNLSLGTPPLTNDNRAASLRLKFKERHARPDSLSLGQTSSHKTYRFPAVPVDTLTNSLEQAETNL